MAGLGSRFGYTFKPFLKATEETFLEWAKKPFDVLKTLGYSVTFHFLVRSEQEIDYEVSYRVQSMFPKDRIRVHTVGDTCGPAETLKEAILLYGLSGSAFVCDCDHSIDITPMLEYLNEKTILIPTWSIEPKDYPHWGKVELNEDGNMKRFVEKESIEGTVRGILGCYFFPNIEILSSYPTTEHLSTIFQTLLNEKIPLKSVPIQKAVFFGTPKALDHFRFQRAKFHTLFLDIDGTLIHDQTGEFLPGSLEKLKEWISQGHTLVLTTARTDYSLASVKQLFKETNIPIHQWVTHLPPGPRYVLNDRKPYLPYYCMAQGLTFNRNHGIQEVELPNPPTLLQTFHGASFAKVYLVSDSDNKLFVRKYISKSKESMMHVDILKRQCEDLKRLNYYKSSLCPILLNEYESSSEYYYDLTYMEGYEPLSRFSSDIIYRVMPLILKDLQEYVYVYQKPLKIDEKIPWLKAYLQEKVYPKFESLPLLNSWFEDILTGSGMKLNDQHYPCIQTLLKKWIREDMCPNGLCPIHGDLTLENILYNPQSGSYCLIDPSGSRYMDAIEMDTAKLFQSLICDYIEWNEVKPPIRVTSNGSYHSYQIPESYLKDKYHRVQHLYKPLDYQKGLFYMSTYFIRMVPFMMAKSLEHAQFVLILASYYLSLN